MINDQKILRDAMHWNVAKLLAFCLLTACLPTANAGLHAQTFTAAEEENVPASEFTLDVEAKPSAYAGSYHFGMSEWESSLDLRVRGKTATGVLVYSEWLGDKVGKWKSRTMRFTGTIVGNMLIANGWNGIFVRRGDQRGLLLMTAKRETNVREFGYRVED